FLGSDFHFTRNFDQFYNFQTFGKFVWASAVRAGFTWGSQLFQSKRFFAGGSTTIRGFETDRVGPIDPFTGEAIRGEAMFIFNQELRFPIYSYVRGVAFYDAGNVYLHNSDFSLSDIRQAAGFGLRLEAPYILARLDFGFNLIPRTGEKVLVIH